MTAPTPVVRTAPGLTGDWKGGLTTRIGFEETSRREADRQTFRHGLAASLGVSANRWAWLQQVHGADVIHVQQAGPHGKADALICDDANIGLLLAVADCCPVLLWQPRGPHFAAAHAGWRGLIAGVLQKTVAQMQRLGAEPSRLRAWIGPSIGPCCFEVGLEVAAQFPESVRLPSPQGRDDRAHIDLRAAAGDALTAAGVPPEAVATCPDCTSCLPRLYWSYRRDGGICGRHLAYIVRPSHSATPA